MMQPYDGPVNWDLAMDTARKTVAQQPDPSPDQRQKDAVADAVRLADHWLDATTDFTSGTTTATAWSRAEVDRDDHGRVEGDDRAAGLRPSAASMGDHASFQARLNASRMPALSPWPIQGGVMWAASPARRTRPLTKDWGTRELWV